MKMQLINGEEWPPSVAEADVRMVYPPGVPKHKQFALGHKVFSMLPGTWTLRLASQISIWLTDHTDM